MNTNYKQSPAEIARELHDRAQESGSPSDYEAAAEKYYDIGDAETAEKCLRAAARLRAEG